MRETLLAIHRIQQLDDRSRACRERMEQFPHEAARMEEQLKESRAALDQVQARQAERAKEKRTLEQEVERINADIRKHQAQLLSVKTNREYSAMMHEIEQEKSKVSEAEEKILLAMESLDELSAAEAREKEAFDRCQKENQSGRQDLEKQAAEARDLADRLAGEREEAIKALPREVLALYERVGKARNGVAAAVVKNGSCGGCYGNLPTQLLNRIRGMDQIITCENCGRILIWQESGQQNKGETGI